MSLISIVVYNLCFREQKLLLEDLFNDIVQHYNFQIQKTHIQVIPGKLEGIYSWIAINYVLGRFQNNNTDSSKILISNLHFIDLLFSICH